MNPTLTSQTSELGSLAAASRFNRAKLNPDAEELALVAKQAEESQQAATDASKQADFTNIDEFTPFVEKEQEKEKSNDQEKRRKRRERRIGVTRKIDSIEDDYDEEDVYDFLGYLDRLWKRLTELVQDVSDEFDNWNKWFKKEKKRPPMLERSRVTYIRDEYQINRSPHLWKSDPNRNWVLGFGHNKVNNIVSSILYKYQNETISKDA